MNNRRLITEHERPLTASGFRVMKGEREFITYQRDVTIRVWHQPNPDSYAPHFHSAIEVCVPLLGGCEVAVKGKVYHVQAGEVLFVPSDATHALRMAAGSERYLIIFEHNAAFTMKEFAALRPMLRQPIYLTAESEATPTLTATAPTMEPSPTPPRGTGTAGEAVDKLFLPRLQATGSGMALSGNARSSLPSIVTSFVRSGPPTVPSSDTPPKLLTLIAFWPATA